MHSEVKGRAWANLVGFICHPNLQRGNRKRLLMMKVPRAVFCRAWRNESSEESICMVSWDLALLVIGSHQSSHRTQRGIVLETCITHRPEDSYRKKLCLDTYIITHWNLLLGIDTWTESHVHMMTYTNTLTNTTHNMAVLKSIHSQIRSFPGVTGNWFQFLPRLWKWQNI